MVFYLICGRKDASNMLSPVLFRRYRFVVTNFHRTSYGSFEAIKNMIRLFNTTSILILLRRGIHFVEQLDRKAYGRHLFFLLSNQWVLVSLLSFHFVIFCFILFNYFVNLEV